MCIAGSRLRPARLAPRFLGTLIAGAVALGASLVTTPAAAGEILSVKNESANFREGPGEKHAIVFAADRFYPVEVLEKKDGWTKVKDFEGDEAWVAERLLARQETVVVEGDRVNVRDKASTTAEIVFKAERGEVFKVEERQGKWLKVVDASGDGGWIRDDMVWGERGVAASTAKGKTKGELDDPAAAPAGKPEASKGKAAPPKDDAADEEKPVAPAAKGGAKPKSDARPAPATKPEPKDPGTKAEPKDAEPEAKPAPKDAEPEAKPEPEDAEPEAKPEPKDAEPEAKPAPKEAEPQPEADAKAEDDAG